MAGARSERGEFRQARYALMVMIGNPPYSVSSSNNGLWINDLMNDYKKDLNERNIQPLSDDYIKFIRLAHYYVEKNGDGVVAYISNNSFIDGIIHRQMRKQLLKTFDSVYVLDLHGNTRKKEISPDGSKDENVFDIMQGVSINIFVKKKSSENSSYSKQNANNSSCHSERSASEVEESSNLAKVYHFELFGKREDKYEYLRTHSLNDVPWIELKNQEPQYFFVPKDFEIKKEFDSFIDIEQLMSMNSSGVKTHHDKEVVSTKRFQTNFNQRYNYRPLDIQWINYDLNIVVRHRSKFMFNFINHDNLGLVLGPQGQAVGSMQWNLAYCSKYIVDTNVY